MIFDFSNCYPKEVDSSFQRYDCTHLGGSKLYCSKETEIYLKEKIKPHGVSGIHFIDSGDYHYISKFMTDLIEEEFTLILIDNHTDMQSTLIEGMTSCGSWAKEVLEQNEKLHRLVLIGPNKNIFPTIDVKCKEKLICVSYEELVHETAIRRLKSLDTKVPIYLSVDKDVLQKQCAITNWDQGEMSLSMLENLLQYLIVNHTVIGIDICGEYEEGNNLPKYIYAKRINTATNHELFIYLSRLFKKYPLEMTCSS